MQHLRGFEYPSDIRKAEPYALYCIQIIYVNNIASRRRGVGPRGAATWPGEPCRIHVGPAQKTPFLLYFYLFKNGLKSKIKSEKSRKIPENYEIHNFQNINPN